jgi:hypothetical protein
MTYDLGVYVFGGWKKKQPYAPAQDPWARIKSISPDREPLQGYYEEGEQAVISTQVSQIVQAGLKWISFDYYWDNHVEYLHHAVDSFIALPDKKGLEFMLMWANHNSSPNSLADFDEMVNNWITRYFKEPSYKRMNGVPLVMIFNFEELEKNAKGFNYTVKQLIDRANKASWDAGHGGVYFICSSVSANEKYLNGGCVATSLYNFHYNAQNTLAHSYAELDAGYRVIWNRVIPNAIMPYIVPMTAGWDSTPWGGWDSDKQHDNCVSTPQTFKAHLLAAKAMMDKYPEATLKMGVICAWNEYGEGSVIEPTKKWGTQYIDTIKSVFG